MVKFQAMDFPSSILIMLHTCHWTMCCCSPMGSLAGTGQEPSEMREAIARMRECHRGHSSGSVYILGLMSQLLS